MRKHLLLFFWCLFTGSGLFAQTTTPVPYFQDFEAGPAGWAPGGTASSWSLGYPNKAIIQGAASGQKAWVTGGLNGNYNNNENSYIESPRFNFTGVSAPQLEFRIWWVTETGQDGAVVMSSISNGPWTRVGTLTPANNWYNSSSIAAQPGNQSQGWSGTGAAASAGWVTAFSRVNNAANQADVRFRIVFKSGATGKFDGIGIDDVKVYGLPDLAVLDITNPLRACDPVRFFTVKLKNNTNQSFDFASVPVQLQVNVSGAGTGSFTTMLDTGTLAAGATMFARIPTPGFQANTPGNYQFTASATLQGVTDGFPGNNTKTKNIQINGSALPSVSLPIREDFEGYAPFSQPFDWEVNNAVVNERPDGNNVLQLDNFGSNQFTQATTPLGGYVTPTTQLAFRYRLDNQGSSLVSLGTNRLQVQVQLDCDTAFTTLYTFNKLNSTFASNSPSAPDLKQYSLSMGQYAGSYARVRFRLISDVNVPLSVMLDEVIIREIKPIDVALEKIEVVHPVTTCFNNQPLKATIRNEGTQVLNLTVNPLTVSFRSTSSSGPAQTKTISVTQGVIPVGGTLAVTAPASSFDFSAHAIYNLQAVVRTPVDLVTSNDTALTSISVGDSILSLPFLTEFGFQDYANVPGWTSTFTGTSATNDPNDRWLRQTLDGNSPAAFLTTPPIGLLQSGDFLYFNYRFLNPNGTAANIAQRGAGIELQASVDCGSTFTTIYTLPATTTPFAGFRKVAVPISSLAGKNAIFRFLVTITNGTVLADIDRLEVKPGGRDVGVAAITSPTQGCAGQSTSIPVTVQIENYSNTTISLSSKPIIVTFEAESGGVSKILRDTIQTGTLAAGATLSHTFSKTYNISTSGQHFFKAYTSIVGDLQHLNDTTTSMVEIIQQYPAPYSDPFSAASNYIWKFDTSENIRLHSNYSNSDYWIQMSTEYSPTNNSVQRTLLSPVFSNITPATKLLIDLGVIDPKSGNSPVPSSLAGTNHQLKIQASGNCFATYATLFTLNSSNYVAGSMPKKYLISLGNLGNLSRVQFRIVLTVDTTAAVFPDFFIDNFAVKVPSSVDAEVTGLILPASNCGLPNNQQVSMLITNRGDVPLTSFSVHYSIANSSATATEQVNTSVPVGETLLYTFNTRANLSVARDYTFMGTITAAGDTVTANNSYTAPTITNRPSVNAPYTQDFTGITTPSQVFIVQQGHPAPAPVLANDVSIKASGTNKFVRLLNAWGQQTPPNAPTKPAWIDSGANGTTTVTDAWVTNTAYHRTLTLCVNAAGISQPELLFDLRQTYTNTPLHNWFRVLINGQQISNDYHPTDLVNDPWKTQTFDLSAYGNSQFQITFQAALADEPDPSYPASADAVFLDNIIIRQGSPAAPDLKVVTVDYTPYGYCSPTSQIVAELKNVSTKNINLALTPLKVMLQLAGPVIMTDSVILNSGIFYSSTSRFITFPNSFNKYAAGNYVATVSVPLSGDVTPLNNTAKGYLSTAFQNPLPFTEDFNNFISFGWDSSHPLNSLGKKLELNFLSTSNNSTDLTITLPKVGPVTANTVLEFDYANYSRITGAGFNYLVTVQASTDCGYSFTNVFSFPSQQIPATKEFTRLRIPVGSFAGQNVRFRLVFHYVSGDFNVLIDNLLIGERASSLEISSVQKPVTGCLANEKVVLALTNRTFTAYSFSQKPLQVNTIITAPNGQKTTLAPVTVNSGTLAAFATRSVQVSSGFNFTQTGTYQIRAYLKNPSGLLLSDTMRFALPRYPAVPVPFEEDFEQIPLDSLPAHWLATRNVGIQEDLYNQSLLAKLNTELDFDTAVIQLPKVALPSGPSFLRFRYALRGNGFSLNSPVYNNATSRVEIQASTNCGTTFSTLRTINRQNHIIADTLQEYWVPLLNYSGQNITLRFIAYRGGMSYTFQLDSVRIQQISGKDASVVSFLLPEDNGCASASQQVKVVVRNAGPVALINAPLHASVNGTLLPAVTATVPAFSTATITVGNFNASTAGMYQLRGYFTLADDMNRLNDTASAAIRINPKPVVSLPPMICAQTGQPKVLDAGPGWLYLWSNGATTRTITVTANGQYSVTITNPATGCSATGQTVVSFSNLPVANLGADTVVCGSIVLSPVTASGVTYLWNTGAITPTLTATSSGTYWVKLTKPSGCSVSDTITVTVKTAPNGDPGPDRVVCTGQTATFSVPAAPGQTYKWVNLTTGLQVSNNPTYTTGTAALYEITVSNNVGCTSRDTIALQVVAQPTVDIGPDTAFCTGSTVLLQATPPSGFTYVWKHNNVIISGATSSTLSVNQVGTYTVTLANGANCTGTDSVMVTQHTPPVAIITQNGTQLTASSGASYQWYKDGILIFGATSQTYSPVATGNYTVAITDNGCTTLSGPVSIVLGAAEEIADTGISLYPNPAATQVELKLSNYYMGEVAVRMLDVTGKEIYSGTFAKRSTETTQQVTLSQIPAGLYLVEIHQKNERFLQKLIINR